MVCKKLGIWISGFLYFNCGKFVTIRSSVGNGKIEEELHYEQNKKYCF